MIFNVIVAIVAVPIITACFAMAILWYARSSTSADPKVRYQARVVEVLTSLGAAVFSLLGAQSARERSWIFAIIGAVVTAWFFRGVRLLMRRRNGNILRA
jgi:uncharacterized membrane protein YeiH